MYEHRRQKVLPRALFARRLANSAALAAGVVGTSLAVGILGYHLIGRLGWIDSFLNASMILSGMGPVDELHSRAAKIFAGCYALFSGIMFLTTAAIIFAPLAHRVLHRFHASVASDSDDSGGSR
jgi:hypothetical protein